MVSCGCGFEAKSPAGLASHRRKCELVNEVSVGGPMLTAMDRTLVELDRLGRFEDVDAAQVESLRQIAAALDVNPFNSQMWRELRESLNEVTRADDEADDGLAAALAQIAGSPSLGDAETA